MTDFSRIISSALQSDNDAQEAIKIARLNSSGTIWMIGGFLFRTIAAYLYSMSKQATDIDFIVVVLNKNLIIPDGWNQTVTHFGSPRLNHKSGRQIDLVALQEVNQIVRHGLAPTIENFLIGVPLTIQSLAYNIDTKELIGDMGINALQTKNVMINDLKQLQIAAERRGQTPEEYMTIKARSLSFSCN